MGLDVIYAHVETKTSLRRTLEQCTLGYSTDGTSITSGHKLFTYNTPPCSKFELGGLTPAYLRYAAATYGASALRIQHLPV